MLAHLPLLFAPVSPLLISKSTVNRHSFLFPSLGIMAFSRYRSNYRAHGSTDEPTVSVVEGVGDVLSSFTVPSLSADDTAALEIEDVEPVASYTWVDKPQPTIIVPGMLTHP